MKIVHFSDWHGKVMELPAADLYICTGDMLQNYPLARASSVFSVDWQIDPRHEIYKQGQFLRDNYKSYRKLLGNEGAPVVVVRGNHDFVPLAGLFSGQVYEISKDATETFEVCGLKVGGFRGIKRIVGEWNDEYEPADLADIVRDLPEDLNVLATHVPPYGLLDDTGTERVGCIELASYINRNLYGRAVPLRLHCFGHIHERFGTIAKGSEGNKVIISNAATGFVELSYRDGEFISTGLGRLKK